jgi:hypothetical protein
LGKQLHRLPNISINAIPDVGLDEPGPTCGIAIQISEQTDHEEWCSFSERLQRNSSINH